MVLHRWSHWKGNAQGVYTKEPEGPQGLWLETFKNGFCPLSISAFGMCNSNKELLASDWICLQDMGQIPPFAIPELFPVILGSIIGFWPYSLVSILLPYIQYVYKILPHRVRGIGNKHTRQGLQCGSFSGIHFSLHHPEIKIPNLNIRHLGPSLFSISIIILHQPQHVLTFSMRE